MKSPTLRFVLLVGFLAFLTQPIWLGAQTSAGRVSVAGVHLGMDIDDAYDALRKKYPWKSMFLLDADGEEQEVLTTKNEDGFVLLMKGELEGAETIVLAESSIIPAWAAETPGTPVRSAFSIHSRFRRWPVSRPYFGSRMTADSAGTVRSINLTSFVVSVLLGADHLDAYQFAAMFRDFNDISSEQCGSGNGVLEYLGDDGTKATIGTDKSIRMISVPSRAEMRSRF